MFGKKYRIEWFYAAIDKWEDAHKKYWTYRGACRACCDQLVEPISADKWRVLENDKPKILFERHRLDVEIKSEKEINHEPI